MQKLKDRLNEDNTLDEYDAFLARFSPEHFLEINGEFYVIDGVEEYEKRLEMVDDGLYIKGDELFKSNPDGEDYKVDNPERNPLSEEIREARKKSKG